MKYTSVFHDTVSDLYVFVTGVKGTGENEMRYGVLVNTKSDSVGDEQPVDSIARWLPYSDFQPFTGELPAEVKSLLEHAKK